MPFRSIALTIAIVAGMASSAVAEVASPWVQGYNSRTRLLAGTVEQAGKRQLYAAIEIALSPGWKTYWRAPGDSGGVPPHFDWSKSENLAEAIVRYPAPLRMKDQAGEAVGYANSVVLPILVKPMASDRPVGLAVVLEYGICRDICVPAEAKIALQLDPASVGAAGPSLIAALEQTPRSAAERRPSDPQLISIVPKLSGDKPHLLITAKFAAGATGVDAFAEASDGIYLPLPARKGAAKGDQHQFIVDLSQGIEASELKGKQVTVTLVSDKGHSEASVRVD
jgi:DsbC/DsbD-like thiol-disulfide interchange protein